MKIEYLKHKEIDFSKWDDCISKSLNSIVYAYSWYLNIVAQEWDAIVVDDYKIVFPLAIGRKFGFTYTFQPLFTQQLGIFSPGIIDKQITQQIIKSIPERIKYLSISFNSFNTLQGVSGDITERPTYQLDLVQPYFTISSNYNQNTKRNISKSMAMGVTVNRMLSVADYIQFKKKNLIVSIGDEQFDKLVRIMEFSLQKGIGEVYAAVTEQQELCAAAFFIRSNGKAIYLSAASNESGKTNRAMFLLVDQFINDNSESHLVLDFEGSSIDSIARFYAGFGAIKCKYQQLIINRLPWCLKLFKR